MSEAQQTSSTLFARRSFLIGIAASGAGMALSVLPGSSKVFASRSDIKASFEPNVWVKVDPDGTTTIAVSKSEMGQGIRTTLAMIVAEEMDADWTKVKVRQAQPNAGNGSLSTGGSGSTSGLYQTLRRAGATVRTMMISAAAKQWSVPESTCSASKGIVTESGGNRRLSYGELTDAAAGITVPNTPTLKDPKTFTLIGSRQTHIDAPDIVRGTAVYGIDVRIPNMKYAVSAMPPKLGASVLSIDAREALKIKGVIKAERLSGVPGVVVVAENTYAALQGRDALIIQWNMGANTGLSSTTISAAMKAAIGTVPDVPASSAIKIEATYELPFLAHACMEPMNCVADVKADSAEIWAPTQSGDSVLSAVASATGLSSSKIKVNTTLMGGGFGRRSQTEYASYAARISAAYKMPILFMYTRQDDIKNDYYRPASLHVMKGGLSASGQVTGWIQKCVPGYMAFNPTYSVSPSTSSGASANNPVPLGAWRSVSNSTAVFANECFIDELAVAAGKDPYEFRRGLLGAGRLRTVLDEVAARAEWTKPLPKGWGRGIACTDAYSYIAHVVEVSVSTTGILKVERIVMVVDCGIAINPMGVEAQLQGACIDAISSTLKAGISVEAGAIKQSNFVDYDWLRMNEMPKIEIHILASTQSPRGMGEAGYPSVSPALCNAIYNATGKRLRTLPIQQNFLSEVHVSEVSTRLSVNVFPNPFRESFEVSGQFAEGQNSPILLSVRNLLGATIVESSDTVDAHGNFKTRIEFPDSADAAYLLTVRIGQTQMTRIIVKQ